MPTLSGMGLHQALIEFAPTQADRIIFVSGGAFSADSSDFLARVANPHLIKPFDGEKLRDAVEILARAGRSG